MGLFDKIHHVLFQKMNLFVDIYERGQSLLLHREEKNFNGEVDIRTRVTESGRSATARMRIRRKRRNGIGRTS